MPIMLSTPHVHQVGHGQPDQPYAFVIIHTQTVCAPARKLILQMQYGNVNQETGEWLPSEEPMRNVVIQNTPAKTQGGEVENPDYDPENPDFGPPTFWGEIEVEAADPKFDELRAAFMVSIEGGELAVSSVTNGWGTEAEGYDLVGHFLYQYLIDSGYYEGTIV